MMVDDEMAFISDMFNCATEAELALDTEVRRLREENERQRFDILAMNQSLDLLREENERLRKDAERYQWFRVSENWRDSGPFDDLYESALDSAIDAARGAK